MEVSKQAAYKVYPYRWVVLGLYFLLNTAIQIMWANFFSITLAAGEYYGFAGEAAQTSAISLFSIIFMLGVVIISVPSMAMFEKYGYRKSVSLGAILMGIGAIIRGIWGDNYTVVLIATIIFAIAQPFIINSMGLVAGKWFPVNERAIANSMGVLPTIIGMMIGMIVVPVQLRNGIDIKAMLQIWGYITAGICVVYVVFTREAPPTPPCAEEESYRSPFGEGIKALFKKKNFVLCALSYTLLLGIFNAIFTLIEPILKFFGGENVTSVEVGLIGAIVLALGLVGGLIIPLLSDKSKGQKRLPYVLLGVAVAGAGLFLVLLSHSVVMLTLSIGLFGLFGIGASPVMMTYSAEACYPVSEGTSEGMMLLAGNIGGAILLGLANLFGTNYFALQLAFGGFVVAGFVIMLFAKEAKGKII
ncbi:MAG: MFS transporter [Spirochaetaceae bacterium]|jgi:MFS family permease|nr:MFS transporter [Spirochaetaceae bacterium]